MDKDSDIVLRESQDGHNYKARETPCDVKLEVVDYVKHDLTKWNSFPVYHMYVTANEIAEKKLPLWEANPREPTVTSPVRKMEETLEKNPEDFVKKNNGLTLLVDSVEYNERNTIVDLDFGEMEGITNGGHTYFAIAQEDTPKSILNNALVRVEVIEIGERKNKSKSDIIKEISRARNAHKALKDSSLHDQLGHYDHLKQWVDDNRIIEWREGDHETYDNYLEVKDFISLLKSVDPSSYHHRYYNKRGDQHRRPAGNSKGVFDDWGDKVGKKGEKPLSHMLPLIKDILYLRDKISYSLNNDKYLTGNLDGGQKVIRNWNLYEEYIEGERNKKRELNYSEFDLEKGINLNSRLEVLFIGMFRNNIWCERKSDVQSSEYIGWFIENDWLWDNRYLEVLEGMRENYNNFGDKEKFIRSETTFENATNNLWSWGTGQPEVYPELIYDKNGSKYILVDGNNEIATHRLIANPSYRDDNRTIKMEKVENQNEGGQMYMEYNSLEYLGIQSEASESDATHGILDLYSGVARIDEIDGSKNNIRLYNIKK